MVYLTVIGRRSSEHSSLRTAFHHYLARVARFMPAEELFLRDEQALFQLRERQPRGANWLVLLDSRGKCLSSEQLAVEWRSWRDSGKRHITLAVGPADGWSPTMRQNADFLLSLGLLTLPHELAAVVAAEQIYRVLTILAGHPYHLGHQTPST